MNGPGNPFDDEQGTYLVLVNDRGQHSLWLAEIDVPSGWTIAHGADTRAACLAWTDHQWTELRPAAKGGRHD